MNNPRCHPPRQPGSAQRVSLSAYTLESFSEFCIDLGFAEILVFWVFHFSCFVSDIWFSFWSWSGFCSCEIRFTSGDLVWVLQMEEDFEFADKVPPSFERMVWFLTSFDYVSVFFCFLHRSDANVLCGVLIWLSGKV